MNKQKGVDIVLMLVFITAAYVTALYIDNEGPIETVERSAVISNTDDLPEPLQFPPEIEEVNEQLSPPEATYTIILKDTKVSPNQLTIQQGESITFINMDYRRNYRIYENIVHSNFNKHLAPFQNVTITYNEPGTFPFRDAIFTYMQGIVVVE